MPFQYLSIVAGLVVCVPVNATAKPTSRFGVVDSTDGHLSVQRTAEQAWSGRVIGQPLPGHGQLRTSSAGPCRVRLQHDQMVTLSADCQLAFDASKRLMTLNRGRVLLQFTDGDAWIVSTPGKRPITIRAVPPCTLQCSTIGTATVFTGQAQVTSNGRSHTIAAPHLVHWNHDGTIQIARPATDGWEQTARAWADMRKSQGLGRLVVADAQSGQSARMEIARFHANVVIKPPVALVQIDESFYNPASSQQQGTFTFNLPRGASISRFAMFVTHTQLIEGEIVERKRASNIYESIVRSMRDPAILEQMGDNLFRMRVFPIPARDTKRILLDFTVPLIPVDGRYQFELPLMGDSEPVWDFKLSGSIDDIDPASMHSPSHPAIEFHQTENGVRFQTSDRMIKLDRDFVVSFTRPITPQFSVRSFVPTQLDNSRYFLASIPPDALRKRRTKPPEDADIIVVVDTSSGSPMDVVRQAARTVLLNLRAGDRFQLGGLDVAYRPLKTGWFATDSVSIDKALNSLEQQFALGGSELAQSMKQAVERFDKAGNRRRLVVYIGNGRGKSTADLDEFEFLVEQNVRLFAAWTGSNQSGQKARHRLQQLAQRNRGRLFDLSLGTTQLGDLFQWMLRGMPDAFEVHVRVEGMSQGDVFVDPFWSDDRSLHVFGKAGSNASVKLMVKVSNGDSKLTFSRVLEFADDESDVFTGRLWAQRKMASLLAASTNDNMRPAVISLSQNWSLLSPFTAFLVLETEADYTKYNIVRQFRHRYWKPADALPRLVPPIGRVIKPRGDVATQSTKSWRVDDALKRIQKHLADEESGLAASAIHELKRLSPELDVKDLETRVLQATQRTAFLDQHAEFAPLFDRNRQRPAESANVSANARLRHANSQQFRKWHPHSEALLKTVSVEAKEMKLTDFVEYLRDELDANIILDESSLASEALKTDEIVKLLTARDISLRSLSKVCLEPLGLTLIDNEHVMEVTTHADAQEQLTTRVYPVGDLIRTDGLPGPGWLANPYLDRAESIRDRIERKLKMPLSVDFTDTPLEDAVKFVAAELGENAWLDERAFEEEGLGTDEPITLRLRKVPGDEVLKWMLKQLGLTAITRNETLQFTTIARADELLEARVYSSVGLIHKLPEHAYLANPAFNGFGVGGGFGGFGGGGGAGGFGGGGGLTGGMRRLAPGAMNGPFGSGRVFGGGPPASFFGMQFDRSLTTPDANDLQPFPENTSRNTAAEKAELWDEDILSDSLLEGTSGPWEDIDGTGGMQVFYTPAMSVVINQTHAVHNETEQLFARLRSLPVDKAAKSTPLPRITAEQSAGWDLPKLSDVIMNSGGEWMEYHGDGGAITPNLSTLSFVVRQTPAAHESLYDLLSQLRRAAFAARTRDSSLVTASGRLRPWSVTRSEFTDLPVASRLDPTRVASDEEIEILSIRQHMANGAWRHEQLHREESPTRVQFRHVGPRSQYELGQRTMRVEGALAAVAYRQLSVVELGAWGDASRREVDSRLPWLPHRSNAELARMFDVTRLGEANGRVRLKLAVPQHDHARIEAVVHKASGRVAEWTAFLNGKPQFQLKATVDGKGYARYGADGRPIERWLPLSVSVPTSIPKLTDSWKNQLVFITSSAITAGLRQAEAADVGAYRRAVHAISRADYKTAANALREGLKSAPEQPMLLFMLAKCYQHDSAKSGVSRTEVNSALRGVAASGVNGFFDDITFAAFPFMTPAHRHGILQLQPESARTPEDWARLAGSWVALGGYDSALKFVVKARQSSGMSGRLFSHDMLELQALIGLKHTEQAAKLARQIAATPSNPADRIARVAEVMAHAGETELGDELFQTALNRKLDPTRQLTLTQRRAALHTGFRRWRILLSAIDDKDIKPRTDFVGLVLSEVHDPADAARLAADFAQRPFAMRLRIREIETTTNERLAADKVWAIIQSGALPSDQVDWAVSVLLRVDQDERVIELVEARLREGAVLSKGLQRKLYSAYGRTGRAIDQERAGSHRDRR